MGNWPLIRLEPYEGKLSRTVLRGARGWQQPGAYPVAANLHLSRFLAMAMFSVGVANREDATPICALLQEYLRDELGSKWLGSFDSVLRDGFGNCFELLVAVSQSKEFIGFAAYAPDYDLHVGVPGGRVMDLYVKPRYRGFGIAPALLAHAAAEILKTGGGYLRGHAVTDPATLRLYDRCAVSFQGPEYNLSARAFRHLANLAGSEPRQMAINLPEKAWNFIG